MRTDELLPPPEEREPTRQRLSTALSCFFATQHQPSFYNRVRTLQIPDWPQGHWETDPDFDEDDDEDDDDPDDT